MALETDMVERLFIRIWDVVRQSPKGLQLMQYRRFEHSYQRLCSGMRDMSYASAPAYQKEVDRLLASMQETFET